MNSTETKVKDKLKHILLFLPKFYKNPVLSIQNAPNLEWIEAIGLQVIVSMISGILSGLVSQNFLYTIWGAFFFPLLSFLISMIATVCIHYGILFLFKEEFSIRQTYILVVLANLPFLAIRTLYPILKSVDVLGFVITAFLLSVGLIENYKLPKQKVIKYMTYFTIFIIFTWLLQYALQWKSQSLQLEMPMIESIHN